MLDIITSALTVYLVSTGAMGTGSSRPGTPSPRITTVSRALGISGTCVSLLKWMEKHTYDWLRVDISSSYVNCPPHYHRKIGEVESIGGNQ